MQYVKHIPQIMQACSEYDLMTNSVKFMQQTTSTLSEGDSTVCNSHLLQSTYLINNPKVKASAENVHLWYKHKLVSVCIIHWCELPLWLPAAAHVTRQLSTLTVHWYHRSSF